MDTAAWTFSVQNLDLAGIAKSLEEAGCVRINGLFPAALMQEFKAWAEIAFRQFDQEIAQDSLDPDFKAYFQLVPHMINHIPSNRFDHFNQLPSLIYQLFLASPLPDILHACYGGSILYSSIHSVLRRQTPTQKQWYTGFHQDGHFLDPRWKFLHCWFPLMECGIDAPSLELIPAGLKSIRPSNQKNFKGDHYYDNRDLDLQSEILPFFAQETFWPQFLAAGDLLLYDSYCLHRTYETPLMSQARYNFEMRFLPDLELPVGIRDLGFIRV
jgi:hypothetical protein